MITENWFSIAWCQIDRVSTWWRHQIETNSALLALESTGLTRASNAEAYCFISCAPEQTAEQTVDMLVIGDAMVFIVMSL